MIQRVCGLDRLYADASKNRFDVNLIHHISHHGTPGARVRLMSGHCGGGVIQYDQCHIRLIVYGVDDTGDSGCKEGGIPHECKAGSVRFHMADALGDSKPRAHTEAGIYHVKRHGVPKGITADIPAEYGLPSFHSRLDRIEGSTVRASCAEYRRTDRKSRRCVCLLTFGAGGSLGRLFLSLVSEKLGDVLPYAVLCIFSGVGHMVRQLPIDLHREMMFPAEIGKLPFNDRVELFDTEHLF